VSGEGGDPIFAGGYANPAGLAVRILDLSGANGADPVEVIRGFQSVAHANAFARRYVRDSVDRCRGRGMSAQAVLDAWFAYGEDAEVVGAGEDGWRSATELKEFAAARAADAEERNWRALDPRRDEEDPEEDGAEE
jgi:hypothetical protein